jgi:hypothetical protein
MRFRIQEALTELNMSAALMKAGRNKGHRPTNDCKRVQKPQACCMEPT